MADGPICPDCMLPIDVTGCGCLVDGLPVGSDSWPYVTDETMKRRKTENSQDSTDEGSE